ncbi:hypothetical protein [Streptomyces sp. NPDC021224]|uniref:hypothetical protein n=1 Tax=unclassified Streptomyces TaxID=2593676 RepID=UPI0037956009
MLLLVPLLGATAAAGGSGGGSSAAPRAAAAATGADDRITYAGTKHRSLGQVTAQDTKNSTPLFGDGPTHYDTQPAALGDQLVFASLRDEPKPQIYLRSADGSVLKLTKGMDAAHPRLTPDGGSVVFDAAEPAAGGGTQRDLWLVHTDGTGLTRLTDTPDNEESPTVSPDGKRIAFSCDNDPLTGPQIYVRDLDGGPLTRVSDPADGPATEPVWNPVDDDAHRDLIAYTATIPPDSGPRLTGAKAVAAAVANGSPRLRVTDGTTDQPFMAGNYASWRAHGASWLPDGNEVVFLSPEVTCSCEGDFDHVFRTTLHADGEPSLVLTEDREVTSPTWFGPIDGGGAIVERDTAANPCIVTLQDVRMDGSDPRDLGVTILEEDPAAWTNTDPKKNPLFVPAAGYDPWSERQNYTPDGRRIVVTRFEDVDPGNPDSARMERIWLVDADGTHGDFMPLAERSATDWDTDPTFSPDGKYIAFTRTSPGGVLDAAGPSTVLIADATTGAITGRITPPADAAQGRDAQPTWSPDGTMLAFTRDTTDQGGQKHIWTAPVADLADQHDVTKDNCPDGCAVIDDSPAFSPDGRGIVFNRKNCDCREGEYDGLLQVAADGSGCKVLLPQGARGNACTTELPDTSQTGPFQPRDAAWTADGKGIVFTSRETDAPNSPEHLRLLDPATGTVTPLTAELAGRQKEPSVQQSVDLAVDAPGTVPPVTVGTPTTVTVNVVNHGPAASPGTVLTVLPPEGVRVTGITWPGHTCVAASLQCDVGVVPPGESVPVTVTVIGDVPGDAPIRWHVTGSVIDPLPDDNDGDTVVPVREAPPTTPPPTTPPPTTPPPTQPPAPPAPKAGPGVHVTAQPNPGYVGGKVVVSYTVRNGRNALATGLRLRIGLPAGLPDSGPPPGCDSSWVCALPDLKPGRSVVVTVVLSPDKALTGTVTGRLTTTGTDADLSDNTARQKLRILQPVIIAVPPIGKPGFVTSVRGKDFPPGVPVRFTWNPGITAAAAPTFPGKDGTFIGQLLILTKDQTGPRTITATGPGFTCEPIDFLVVSGSIQPPDEVTRR